MNILKTFHVKNLKQPIPLPRYLMHNQRGYNKQKVSLLMHKKWVLVNDVASGEDAMVKNGDEIKITSPYTIHDKIIAEDIPLEILCETPHWLVVNKPAGMACHGGLGSYWGTLLNALSHHFKVTGQHDVLKNGLVHRLDKHTSGLMVIAKTKVALDFLSAQFKHKTAGRKYHALVYGNVGPGEGTINIPIGRNPKNHLDIRAYPDESHGKTAITHYKVIKRLDGFTLLECVLETGRTNQIRIHLQYIGHSIVGDKRYPPAGGATVQAERMLLHAYLLEFKDLDGGLKSFMAGEEFEF